MKQISSYSLEYYRHSSRRLFEKTRDGKMLDFNGEYVEFDESQIPNHFFLNIRSAKSAAKKILDKYPEIIVAIVNSLDRNDKIFITDDDAQKKILENQKTWYDRKSQTDKYENLVFWALIFLIPVLVVFWFFFK